MTRTLFRRDFDPVVMLLVLFSICGFALSEMIAIYSPGAQKNNAVNFSVQSLEAASLLIPLWMARYAEYPKLLGLIVVLVIAVSLPTSLQLYGVKNKSDYTTIGRDESALVSVIKTTKTDSVFLYPLRMAPSCATHLGGRQGVFDGFYSFARDNAGEKEAGRRMEDVKMFFGRRSGWGTTERVQMLRRYKVDYVYVPLSFKDIFDGDPMLSIEYLNSSYVMYRVSL